VVAGINHSEFYQSNNCGTLLAAGGSCTVSMEVAPASASVRFASLVLTDNAADSPQAIPLSATGIHDVVLTWVASVSSGVIGYYVYRGAASGEESTTPLNSTPVNAVFYVDTAVVPGATYYYVVTATNGSLQSVYSNEAAAVVPRGSQVIVTH
jgi:fibronectin type 3 domain-containing protein